MSYIDKYQLSIVIPVYNNENELCETVTPFLDSKKEGYEIIFINDGSSDNSKQMMEKIKADNPQIPISIFNQSNQGVSVARNKGIELAQGKYIYFCDADDRIADSFIESVFRKIPYESDMIFWKHNILRTSGMQYLEYEDLDCDIQGRVSNRDFFLKCVMQDRFRLCMGTYLVKKELLRAKNICFTPNCQYGEDLEFILKIIINSRSLCCIPEELYTYIRRGTSAMGKFTLRRFDAPKMVLRLVQYIDDNRIDISDENYKYIKEKFFAKQFIYSLESCLQYLALKEYGMFWRSMDKDYPGLIVHGINVLKKIPVTEMEYMKKRLRLMKWNIYIYSFCIMFKNSLKQLMN